MQEYTGLTNAELAVEPKPGKRCALHMLTAGIMIAVDLVKDAPAHNCDCNGYQHKTENGCKDKLLLQTDAASPKDGNREGENFVKT